MILATPFLLDIQTGLCIIRNMDIKKYCYKCKTEKELLKFSRDRSRSDGLSNRCKSCECEKGKKYRRRYPDKERLRKLNYQFGLTLQNYNAMLKEQNGVCAICGLPEPIENRRLPVDHCHDTGKVRGLLCTRCNIALGQFKDDLDILTSAVSYLRNGRMEKAV